MGAQFNPGIRLLVQVKQPDQREILMVEQRQSLTDDSGSVIGGWWSGR